jgi:hypothetical protein
VNILRSQNVILKNGRAQHPLKKVLNWGGMFGCLFLILVDSFISKVVIVVIVVIVVNAVTYVHV